jgi:hypothetical protein
MIGKILNPASERSGTANIDFNYGFCDVYPEYTPPSGEYDDTHLPLLKELRARAYNGLYHLGGTKRGLWVHNTASFSTKDFEVVQKFPAEPSLDKYYVNPHAMVRTIVDHFPTFIDRLKNPDVRYDGMREV